MSETSIAKGVAVQAIYDKSVTISGFMPRMTEAQTLIAQTLVAQKSRLNNL